MRYFRLEHFFLISNILRVTFAWVLPLHCLKKRSHLLICPWIVLTFLRKGVALIGMELSSFGKRTSNVWASSNAIVMFSCFYIPNSHLYYIFSKAFQQSFHVDGISHCPSITQDKRIESFFLDAEFKRGKTLILRINRQILE